MKELFELPAHQTLADALVVIAAQFGKTIAVDGIAHGLSLERGKLSPVFLTEAAARAGLVLNSLDTRRVTPEHCPLLFAHPDGRAIVISSMQVGGLGQAIGPGGGVSNVLLGSLNSAGFSLCWSAAPSDQRDVRTNSTPTEDFSWFHRALGMAKPDLWPVILATVMINVFALAVPLISMNVFDRVLSHAAFETLWALALGGILALSCEFVLRTLRGELIDRASARSDVFLSNGILRRVLGARLTGKGSSVGVQANSLREYESLREIYNSSAVAALGDLPFAILFLFVIWMVAGPLAIVPLVAAPLLLIAGVGTQWKLSGLSKEHFKDMAHKSAVAVEILTGLQTLKAHAGESWAAFKWESAVAAHLKHSIAMRRWSSLSSNLIIALQGLTTIALLVTGVYLVVAGSISPGALFAASMLSGRCLSPVAQVAALLGKLHTAKSAYQAIRQLASVEQERPAERQMLSGPSSPEAIRFENVEFSYSNNSPAVLRDISLVIRPGEKLGIMGGIGSGKSSLLQLIMGLRAPTRGSVTMGGIPIGQIDPGIYRKMFGIAFQEEELFFGSVHENISFHRPGSSEADVFEAARLSGAINWIKSFPAGFGTVVSEGGRNLSSGQRQTLALARAFVGRPPIMVLDEPSSNLDIRSEAALVQNMKNLGPEVTLIAVSHRLPVLDACDRLVVLDAGKVVLDGEKALVLARLKQMTIAQRPTAEAAS